MTAQSGIYQLVDNRPNSSLGSFIFLEGPYLWPTRKLPHGPLVKTTVGLYLLYKDPILWTLYLLCRSPYSFEYII